MAKLQADLSREQAGEYRERRHAEARKKNLVVDQYILGVGRDNDIALGGTGARHAIIEYAQRCARRGATYGEVIGQEVTKGNGKRYKIKECDLLGYVVANGYCTLLPPEGTR